jgi:hypothetical protein
MQQACRWVTESRGKFRICSSGQVATETRPHVFRTSQLAREGTANMQLDPIAHGFCFEGQEVQQLLNYTCKSKHHQLRIHLQSHREPSVRGTAVFMPATCLYNPDRQGSPRSLPAGWCSTRQPLAVPNKLQRAHRRYLPHRDDLDLVHVHLGCADGGPRACGAGLEGGVRHQECPHLPGSIGTAVSPDSCTEPL